MIKYEWRQVYFDLTSEHVALLRRANVGWNDIAYEGAPAFDCKRPFGNGDIVSDIAEIIGMERIEADDEDVWPKGARDRCMKLYRELDVALQVVLTAGTFDVGKYQCDEYHSNWRKAD